ncbi:hypothetical protein HanRHA438_Chr08g0365871 [Helianthus annuus]|nr:hypothetical protein HanRHA438_Chr08g0365871 [Helianthus annuus]
MLYLQSGVLVLPVVFYIFMDDAWSKTGLAELKELFGSFTDHRDEKRATEKRNGSTTLKKWEK